MDLPIFNACKLFSPKHFLREFVDRDVVTKEWLRRLLDQFSHNGSFIVENDKCYGEYDEFVAMLFRAFPQHRMHEAWKVCSNEREWIESYPYMMRLWQAILVIHASTSSCERGFSKQNEIKSQQRASMGLNVLEALMFISLNAPEDLNNVDWIKMYELWNGKKTRRVHDINIENIKMSILSSPFHSLLLDESTDRTLEEHLIAYITFQTEGGKGNPTTKFIKLVKIGSDTAQAKYNAICTLLDDIGLDKRKMIATASNGASSMRGVNEGLIAKMRRYIPHLIGIHCIAHHEALDVVNSCKHFLEMLVN